MITLFVYFESILNASLFGRNGKKEDKENDENSPIA